MSRPFHSGQGLSAQPIYSIFIDFDGAYLVQGEDPTNDKNRIIAEFVCTEFGQEFARRNNLPLRDLTNGKHLRHPGPWR
jgi:hypothetical protein